MRMVLGKKISLPNPSPWWGGMFAPKGENHVSSRKEAIHVPHP